MPLPIEDYALIGDCHTAALVGKDGSIDWLCLPRFDSAACFAALLGTPDHGRWLLTPMAAPRSVRRRYQPGTLVLETDLETDDGAVTILDFMPPRDKHVEVVRIVIGRRGAVPMRTQLTIRFDYGSVVPWVRRLDKNRGMRAVAGPEMVYCRSEVPLRGEAMHTVGHFTVCKGDRIAFTLTGCSPYEPEPDPTDPEKELQRTQRWWRRWSKRCTYRGRWRQHVLRSLITLKALTYAPTGGIVAAPTTSLPEQLGGVRNWDYRYCWLRDTTFVLYALTVGGYTTEARAWRNWLVNAIAGAPADLQIMYGLAGERRLTELEIPWLPGYANSSPVRIGNAAFEQRQLDIYGELMDCLHSSDRLGIAPNAHAWQIQRVLIDHLCTVWEQPDKGIWEIRGQPRPFTYSKVMAWVAFDRAVKAVEQFGQKTEHLDGWRRARDDVRREVLAAGYNRKVNAFTQYYGSSEADASLLLLPMVGFIDAKDPRMRGTVDLVMKQLQREHFVLRYPPHSRTDALPGGEGVFLICTFWLVDNLALQGRHNEARELFERLLSLQNDVGLLSEEYDLSNHRLVGNFPQAFSHVGLINSARNLARTGGPAEHRGA